MTSHTFHVNRIAIFKANRIADTVLNRDLYCRYKVKGYGFDDIVRGFNKLGKCCG